jgi:inner membrane protein
VKYKLHYFLILKPYRHQVLKNPQLKLKLKNNATYISHHRGITHSIPFTILWPILLAFIIYVIFPHIDVTHIWMWAQLAVFLHVFVDIFNSYGTQALRPISNKDSNT